MPKIVSRSEIRKPWDNNPSRRVKAEPITKRMNRHTCRVVVEKIMEGQGWSPEEMLEWLRENTRGPFSDSLKAEVRGMILEKDGE